MKLKNPKLEITILTQMKDHLIQTADDLIAELNKLPLNVRKPFQEQINALEVAVFKTRGYP